MKQLIIASLAIIFLSSCLKQSISDAMIENENTGGGKHPSVATMSYAVNGKNVTTSVDYPDKQVPGSRELYCDKTFYQGTNIPVYYLDCISTSGELTFTFMFTDSLTVGTYKYNGQYGEMFILDYNNTNGFVVSSPDNMTFTITSYTNGHISGNFSGKLSPMVTSGYPTNTYGTPGSVVITNGTFKDVPVFY